MFQEGGNNYTQKDFGNILALRLYIFYKIWFEPLFKPDFVQATQIPKATMLEEIEAKLFLLMEKKAFAARLIQEFGRRLHASPINYNLLEFIYARRDGRKDSAYENFMNLLKMSKANVPDLNIPEWYVCNTSELELEKDGAITEFMLEEIKKIDKETPGLLLLMRTLDQKYKYFTKAVRNKFINRINKDAAKKRRPPGGELISLSDPVLPDNLSDVTRLELLADTNPKACKASAIELHRKMLESAFGKRGVDILEIMHTKGLTSKNQRGIAKELHCTERTVREYQRKFAEKRELLLEIFDTE